MMTATAFRDRPFGHNVARFDVFSSASISTLADSAAEFISHAAGYGALSSSEMPSALYVRDMVPVVYMPQLLVPEWWRAAPDRSRSLIAQAAGSVFAHRFKHVDDVQVSVW
jgi:hypothetical protein